MILGNSSAHLRFGSWSLLNHNDRFLFGRSSGLLNFVFELFLVSNGASERAITLLDDRVRRGSRRLGPVNVIGDDLGGLWQRRISHALDKR